MKRENFGNFQDVDLERNRENNMEGRIRNKEVAKCSK